MESTENEKLYCIGKRPSFSPMIACDGRNCKIEWFHYACVKSNKVQEIIGTVKNASQKEK